MPVFLRRMCVKTDTRVTCVCTYVCMRACIRDVKNRQIFLVLVRIIAVLLSSPFYLFTPPYVSSRENCKEWQERRRGFFSLIERRCRPDTTHTGFLLRFRIRRSNRHDRSISVPSVPFSFVRSFVRSTDNERVSHRSCMRTRNTSQLIQKEAAAYERECARARARGKHRTHHRGASRLASSLGSSSLMNHTQPIALITPILNLPARTT